MARAVGDQLHEDELERVVAEKPPAPTAAPAPAAAERTVTEPPSPTAAETAALEAFRPKQASRTTPLQMRMTPVVEMMEMHI
ncbi:MAG TPA: hypothetical protein VJ762_15160 [Sphingobium sp.]|nr:hypothetical protein [Sphingobium sp.]